MYAALAGDEAYGQTATDDLPVGREIGAYPEQGLRAARMDAEARHDFVEDERRCAALSVIARSSCRNSTGCSSGWRLWTGSTRTAASSVHRPPGCSSDSGVAVVEHEDVLDHVRRNPGCDRHRAQCPVRRCRTHENLVEDAVIGAGEHRDLVAAA